MPRKLTSHPIINNRITLYHSQNVSQFDFTTNPAKNIKLVYYIRKHITLKNILHHIKSYHINISSHGDVYYHITSHHMMSIH